MNTAYNTHKDNVFLSVFSSAFERFSSLIEDLSQSPEFFAFDSDQLETHLFTEGLELMRLLLQAHYDLRAPARPNSDIVGEEGLRRTFSRSNTTRIINSRFGSVRLQRVAFCRDQTPQLCPLDAELNLAPQKLSRHVQKLACQHIRDTSFENSQYHLQEQTGLSIGNRQLEETAIYVAQDFDSFYEQREVPTSQNEENHLILTTDAKGVAMIERDLRPETRKRAQKKRERGESSKRHLGSGEKRERKRMATVGAVYEQIPNIRLPEQIMAGSKQQGKCAQIENKRVWAELECSTRRVVELVFEEANRRDPQGARQWAMLVDGDPNQMDAVIDQVEMYQAEGFSILVIVDLIHVAEYLWKSANALFGATSEERDGWVRSQLLRLLQGEPKRVVHAMRVSAGKRGLEGEKLKMVRESADYIERRLECLRYDDALEVGLPIATGVIEGACRHLVNDRLGITGAKWSLATAQAVLRLRALNSSGDWEAYWKWHKQKSYEREHAARYAKQTPPRLVYTGLHRYLRLVS